MCVCVCVCVWLSVCVPTPVFLISSYGAPLAQRASYLAQHSSHFGTDGTVNYDYIVTNSINCLLIGSRCIPNGAHASKRIKNSVLHVHVCVSVFILSHELVYVCVYMYMYFISDSDEYVQKNVATLIREIAKHTPEVCTHIQYTYMLHTFSSAHR